MIRLVLLRHGESEWNLSNRFTGWTDVDLTEKGVDEATFAGEILKAEGFEFDKAYCSVLIRARRTLDLAIKAQGQTDLPVVYDWRLNERHYGALQGLNKAETARKYGDEQVMIWRRSFDIPPPELEDGDERLIGSEEAKRYGIPLDRVPRTECLKDCVTRFLPLWHERIAPDIGSGKRIIVAAHGNSLRALVKYLDNISDEDIVSLNIPTGIPLIYELDDDLKVLRNYYLGDQEMIAVAVRAVADQAKPK